MIVSSPFDKDLLGHEIRGVNTSYYGLSALQAVINHDGQVPINYEKISPLFLEKKDAIEWAVTQNYWDIRLIEEEVL